jgi:importin-5
VGCILCTLLQELFRPFYAQVMPLLKHILMAAKGKTQRRLGGKTLECISLIGMSVGKETFYDDARDFMLYLKQLNTVEMDSDDPMLTYVQSAGTRMCKCLGHDFVQMLPDFVPPLVRSAGKKSELQVCSAARTFDVGCFSKAWQPKAGHD